MKALYLLKSKSGSSLLQVTIASAIAVIILYATTSSMLSLNQQSNIVNLKMEVNNLTNMLESATSKRLSCSRNLINNGIIIDKNTPSNNKLTFDTAGKSIGLYTSADLNVPIVLVIPTPGNLNVNIASDVKLINVVSASVTQHTADLEVAYTHNFNGLLQKFKPIVIKGLSISTDATGVAQDCQLRTKVLTGSCYTVNGVTNNFANPDNNIFWSYTPDGVSVNPWDMCGATNPTPGSPDSLWRMTCRPGFRVTGCSSANLQIKDGTVSNVNIESSGCSVPNSARNTNPDPNKQSRLIITCLGEE